MTLIEILTTLITTYSFYPGDQGSLNIVEAEKEIKALIESEVIEEEKYLFGNEVDEEWKKGFTAGRETLKVDQKERLRHL